MVMSPPNRITNDKIEERRDVPGPEACMRKHHKLRDESGTNEKSGDLRGGNKFVSRQKGLAGEVVIEHSCGLQSAPKEEAVTEQGMNCSRAGSYEGKLQVRESAFMGRGYAALSLLLMFAMSVGKISYAQQPSASASPGQQSTATVADSKILVLLVGTVDSRKVKAGDVVKGKTALVSHLKDGTLIARGSKAVGHVVQAKARARGDTESSLKIVFDKIEVPGGHEVELSGFIGAVAPPLPPADNPWAGIGYGSIDQSVERPPTPHMDPKPVPLLNEQSGGVLGLKNLQLEDGVLSSDQKSVKLEDGSQLMVQAQIGSSRPD